MKYFGHKTLLSLVTILVYIYIIAGDKPQLYIPAIIISCILAALFVPIVIVSEHRIKLYTLNPFATRINIQVDEIENIHVVAAHFYFKMTFTLKDGSTKTTSSHFRYYDMEALYNAFTDLGIDTTSTGVRAIEWKK